MIQIVLIISTILCIELLNLLPIKAVFQAFLETSKKSKRVLFSKKIPDEKKEKILPIYALRLFRFSIFIPFLLIVSSAAMVIIPYLALQSIPATIAVLSNMQHLLLITVTAMLYLFFRDKLTNASIF